MKLKVIYDKAQQENGGLEFTTVEEVFYNVTSWDTLDGVLTIGIEESMGCGRLILNSKVHHRVFNKFMWSYVEELVETH